jgi:hypothetical protein
MVFQVLTMYGRDPLASMYATKVSLAPWKFAEHMIKVHIFVSMCHSSVFLTHVCVCV